uniref:Phlebovirus glycoprotein G2 fusion domain-containing protein n=1 Tax=Syphacia muris TaxID=451379 RepID=A0A0N5AC95_9BILA
MNCKNLTYLSTTVNAHSLCEIERFHSARIGFDILPTLQNLCVFDSLGIFGHCDKVGCGCNLIGTGRMFILY